MEDQLSVRKRGRKIELRLEAEIAAMASRAERRTLTHSSGPSCEREFTQYLRERVELDASDLTAFTLSGYLPHVAL